MKNAAIILIVLGVIFMIITGINIITEEEVLDLGKIEINKKENNPVSWSPLVGGALLLGGIVMFFLSRKKA
jgi:LPXTG-motif cell wall-anchored protein